MPIPITPLRTPSTTSRRRDRRVPQARTSSSSRVGVRWANAISSSTPSSASSEIPFTASRSNRESRPLSGSLAANCSSECRATRPRACRTCTSFWRRRFAASRDCPNRSCVRSDASRRASAVGAGTASVLLGARGERCPARARVQGFKATSPACRRPTDISRSPTDVEVVEAGTASRGQAVLNRHWSGSRPAAEAEPRGLKPAHVLIHRPFQPRIRKHRPT